LATENFARQIEQIVEIQHGGAALETLEALDQLIELGREDADDGGRELPHDFAKRGGASVIMFACRGGEPLAFGFSRCAPPDPESPVVQQIEAALPHDGDAGRMRQLP
jgi:hypothetical protein